MSINEVCLDVQLLNIINIFKSLISIATIMVPVILVILIIIDIIKTISSNDVDTKKLSKSILKRLIGAIMVFLVPAILNFVINIIPTGSSYYLSCYQNASKEKISLIAKDNVDRSLTDLNSALANSNYEKAYLYYEEARINIKKIPDKSLKNNYNKNLNDYYKPLLNDLKNGYLNISNSEGSFQTTKSKSTYTYEDVEKILKKYKNLSEERKNIVLKAASYKGKIPYVWGGTANSSGNFPKGGLDCSHFVDFIFWKVMGDNLGNENTKYIWNYKSYKISESELLPGDVGFENNYDDPSETENHIGIFVGIDDKGNKVWIHEAGKPFNNVVINNRSLPNYRRISILK